ncbi:hypothetical protein DFS34DRAFT_650558 [Phlyctochytrium arcticum]|nr:hypothetical protein DFS34DRAFT_650558 [Phlyctochytrium arcticum]
MPAYQPLFNRNESSRRVLLLGLLLAGLVLVIIFTASSGGSSNSKAALQPGVDQGLTSTPPAAVAPDGKFESVPATKGKPELGHEAPTKSDKPHKDKGEKGGLKEVDKEKHKGNNKDSQKLKENEKHKEKDKPKHNKKPDEAVPEKEAEQPPSSGHGHGGSDSDENDGTEVDHESLHGEPGVMHPIDSIFPYSDRFDKLAELQKAYDGSLKDIRIVVDSSARPPIFVAKHDVKSVQEPGSDRLFASDDSLHAVLYRAIQDGYDDEHPVIVIDAGCNTNPKGHAFMSLLAVVRGAGAVHCLLSPKDYENLGPVINMAGRLNFADENNFALHTTHFLDPTKINNHTDDRVTLDDLPLVVGPPVGLLRIPALPIPTLTAVLRHSPKLLVQRGVRHIVIDFPTITAFKDPKELTAWLTEIHDMGYDLQFLPSTYTYNSVSTGSYVGSTYSAPHLGTNFMFVPHADYELIYDTFKRAGDGGPMRMWWTRRDDETVKALMATRAHGHR